MQAYSLDKAETLRAHLAKTHCLFEVRDSAENSPQWQQISSDDHTPFRAIRLPQFSPKAFFFAEREQLFTFNGSEFVTTLPDAAPQALFAVNACDLTAVAYQDQFFAKDAHYQRRRSATLLVGIDCLSPCDGGFCPSVDAGPAVREHTADLILIPQSKEPDTAWFVAVTNSKGKAALQGLELQEAPADWQALRNMHEREAIEAFPDASHILTGVEHLNAGRVSAELWETLGVQCLACSGCTSLCPTCSCYTTYERDTGADDTVVTERCWDSCLYDGFQREASGHNPSTTPGHRIERFWQHKFSNDFVTEFGRYGCVGCGRCEQTCPGVIGVHSVMRQISTSCTT